MAGTPVLKTSPLSAQFRGRDISRAPFSRVVTAVAQKKVGPAKKEPRGLLNGTACAQTKKTHLATLMHQPPLSAFKQTVSTPHVMKCDK